VKWTALLFALLLTQRDVKLRGESPAAFIEQARQATRVYQDQTAAILDGYRRIGRDFPAMGEHWIKIGLLFDGKIDAAHPEVLAYATVSGKPRLLGLAYVLPLLQGESAPDYPAGREAWHAHFRTLDDETFLAQDHSTSHGEHGPRLAMLHAWIWAPNPEGMFAADNWNIPYLRLGITPPAEASNAAAKALSLATGGAEYFLMAVDAAASPTPGERGAIEGALLRSRRAVEELLRDRPGTALSSSDVRKLSDLWNQLWITIDASVGMETRHRLEQLSIRSPM
jgi:hypothetical protein